MGRKVLFVTKFPTEDRLPVLLLKRKRRLSPKFGNLIPGSVGRKVFFVTKFPIVNLYSNSSRLKTFSRDSKSPLWFNNNNIIVTDCFQRKNLRQKMPKNLSPLIRRGIEWSLWAFASTAFSSRARVLAKVSLSSNELYEYAILTLFQLLHLWKHLRVRTVFDYWKDPLNKETSSQITEHYNVHTHTK